MNHLYVLLSSRHCIVCFTFYDFWLALFPPRYVNSFYKTTEICDLAYFVCGGGFCKIGHWNHFYMLSQSLSPPKNRLWIIYWVVIWQMSYRTNHCSSCFLMWCYNDVTYLISPNIDKHTVLCYLSILLKNRLLVTF